MPSGRAPSVPTSQDAWLRGAVPPHPQLSIHTWTCLVPSSANVQPAPGAAASHGSRKWIVQTCAQHAHVAVAATADPGATAYLHARAWPIPRGPRTAHTSADYHSPIPRRLMPERTKDMKFVSRQTQDGRKGPATALSGCARAPCRAHTAARPWLPSVLRPASPERRPCNGRRRRCLWRSGTGPRRRWRRGTGRSSTSRCSGDCRGWQGGRCPRQG